MQKDIGYFLISHVIFIFLCILILLVSLIPIGIKLFILVVCYNLIIPLFGFFSKNQEWLHIWFFSLLVSVFQIFPDWFLSSELKILVFPEDGLFKIGTVSGYMIGLWAIPFFIILFLGVKMERWKSKKLAYSLVAMISLIIFGAAELSMWTLSSWYPQNVTLIFDHLAVYIIIPELFLGLSCFYCFNKIKKRKIYAKISLAFLIMIIYLGNAVFFYFLIEKIILINF